MTKRNLALLFISAFLGVLAVGVASSYAKNGADDPAGDARGGGGNRVVRSGDCSGRSNWKLKAKHDNGRIETEFEVDQNRSGVRWRVRLRHNGRLVVNTHRRTRSPSGSFSLERRLRNGRGKDRIKAFAKRRGGETCRASLRI